MTTDKEALIALAEQMLALEKAMQLDTDIIDNSGKWDRHFARINDLEEYLRAQSTTLGEDDGRK